jgi:hypothetical protein
MAKANMQHKDTEETTKIVTRDALGELAGMSGKSYETGQKVVEKIDQLKDQGKEKEAEKLEKKLNASISGAAKEIASKKKKPLPERPDPDFWFEDDLLTLIEKMEKTAERLMNRRRSTTPSALSWFFNMIQEDAKGYRTWLKENLNEDCPVCGGTMFIKGVDCRNCISGKVGVYSIQEPDIPEDNIIDISKLEKSEELETILN